MTLHKNFSRFCNFRAWVILCGIVTMMAPAARGGKGGGAEDDSLKFFNNWFVTGDYVVAGTGLRGKGVGGFATGTINMTGVPAGAEPVAAFLYWSTVETSSTPGARDGYFNGYKIRGAVLGDSKDPNPACWSSGGTTGPKGSAGHVYRADVLRYLPVNAANVRQANGAHTVKLLDSGGNGNGNAPFTNGATLVLIYRVVAPGQRLRAVVIYDGAFTMDKKSSGMTQNVAGFYQADAVPGAKITGIVANGQSGFSSPFYVNQTLLSSSPFVGVQGGRWDNPTYNFSLAANASSFSTRMTGGTNQTCLTSVAIVTSLNVKDTDADGLLDVWETSGLHRNTQVSPATFGTCSDYPAEPCVDLPRMGPVAGTGSNPAVKDIFVEIDWMHGNGDGTGGTDSYGAHIHKPKLEALKQVSDAFAAKGLRLHFDVGANYQGSQGVCGGLCNFIVPTGSGAQGGSDMDEATLVCQDTPQHPCSYHAPYPVLSFEFGFASVKDGNRLLHVDPHFAQNRKDAFHYGLFAHALGGPYNAQGHPVDPVTGEPSTVPKSYSGIAHRPGGGFMVTFGLWRSDVAINDQVGSALAQAGTLMHELGHNLNLAHGGLSSTPTCMSNYISVMNYMYQTRGLTDASGLGHVDYSNGTLAGIVNENSLSVNNLGASTPYRIRFYGPLAPTDPPNSAAQLHCGGSPITDGALRIRLESPTVGTPDWSNKTNNWATNPTFIGDVNFDGTTGGVLTDQPDWTNLNLSQIGSGYRFAGLSLGALATDGGVFATDGGVFATDAGALATDGGVFATDGGVFATDGGAFATDGGVFATDGGVFATDGGAFATDAGELDYETAVLSSVDPPKPVVAANTINSIVLTLTPPDNGNIQSYNIYRCAGTGCVPAAPAFRNLTGGTAAPSFTDAVNDFVHAGATCPAASTCYNTTYTYSVTSLAVVSAKLIESVFSQPAVTGEVAHLFVIADNKTVVYGTPLPTPTFQISGNVAGSLTSGVSCVYSPAIPSNAGTYPIVCSGPATTSPTNGVSYNAAYLTYIPGVLTITPAPQSINFAALADKAFGALDFPLSATASSLLPVTFVASGSCSVTASTVHLTGTGSCTITAQQPGNGNYYPALDVVRSFNIATNFTTLISNGTAGLPIKTPGSITMTNAIGQASSAWFPAKQTVGNGFTAQFTFQMTAVSPGPADGFALVIQNSSTAALGGGGGLIGYEGIANSLAIEFDTYLNGWDPDANHVAVQSNGTLANSANHGTPAARALTSLTTTNLADGAAHTAKITYDGNTTLSVFLDGSAVPVLVATVNPNTLLTLDPGGKAWIGFTSATGAEGEVAVISGWSFSSN